jgi:hypothetical protein
MGCEWIVQDAIDAPRLVRTARHGPERAIADEFV